MGGTTVPLTTKRQENGMERMTMIDDAARAQRTDLNVEELRARFQTAAMGSLRARLRGDLTEAARLQREAIRTKRMHEGVDA